jgi:hypothetical protein
MTTEVNDPKARFGQGSTTRVLAAIAKAPEQKTSKSGNTYIALTLLVEDGLGGKTWWNAKVMENLAVLCPSGFFEQWRYAKFVGLGSSRDWEKDGKKGTSHDLMVSGIELQDRSFIRVEREPGSEG